jgi:hypothetical protein
MRKSGPMVGMWRYPVDHRWRWITEDTTNRIPPTRHKTFEAGLGGATKGAHHLVAVSVPPAADFCGLLM